MGVKHECASETVRLFVLEGMTDVDSRYLGDTVTVTGAKRNSSLGYWVQLRLLYL